MKIKFKHCRRKRIRKFLSGFHGKERTDLYKIFTAITYLVYTGCQWKLPSPRPLVGAFLHLFRSRWSPIAPSRAKENHSTIDRPAVNIYCRTGSYIQKIHIMFCNLASRLLYLHHDVNTV